MVFDWFQRSSVPEAQPGGQPEPESGPPSALQEPDAGAPESAQSPSPPQAHAGANLDGPQASPVVSASSTPLAGVDSEALEWARQAYARLKAQQEASRQQAQAGSPEPAPPESAPQELAPPEPPAAAGPAFAPAPPAAVEQPGAPSPGQSLPADQPAPPSQSFVPDQPEPSPQPASEAQPGAVSQVPEPAKPGTALSVGVPTELPAAGSAPGLSLLEQAAAQRAERQRELLALAIEEPAPQAAPGAWSATIAGAAPALAAQTPASAAEAEPQLGAFDADFTWSAEVLAAQGRRADQVSLEEIDWLGRLRRGLEKTRRNFVTQLLTNLGDDPLTPEVLDDLETLLLQADVGVKATDQALGALRERLNVEVVDPSEGIRFLKDQLKELLEAPIRASGSALLAPQRDRLNVWLLVGVNGVGKTTTLGKLANLATRSGYSCLIAAADTFRAAAVEQVRVWGDRSGVTVVSNPSANADPAAVVFDAIGAAQSKGLDLVLVDTAGRLQTKHNLMEELAKVRRIVDRLAPEAAVESLLVLDASQGQNGLRQAMAFAKAAGLTGVVLTKLDGSARGGVALAVASEAGLPIRFIGAGEGIRDLRPFNSFEFVEALLDG